MEAKGESIDYHRSYTEGNKFNNLRTKTDVNFSGETLGDRDKFPKPRPRLVRTFCIKFTTEFNHRSDSELFYGPYAHIRKTLDYNYHSNYTKERQWLQDSIIEEMMGEMDKNVGMIQSGTETPDINATVCTTPTDPWLIFTAGVQGAGKNYTIQSLVEKGRLPLLGYVAVDQDLIGRSMPEFAAYAERSGDAAGEFTKKEAGYIAEILTLAALQAGKNVILDGCLRDTEWYKGYFESLKAEFGNLRIAILHIKAPKGAVFQWGMEVAMATNRIIPREKIEKAMEEIPTSVATLKEQVDFFCEILNYPKKDFELVTDGITWSIFQVQWLQSCAYIPGKLRKKLSLKENVGEHDYTTEEKIESSNDAMKVVFRKPKMARHFSTLVSSEENHKMDDLIFYGSYAHIRKTLDYEYHCNYRRERQLLQDAIIADMLKMAEITDVNGDVCTTPTEPFIVFTAGAMGAGKSYVIESMQRKGRFPLLAFVRVDPDEIRQHIPEFQLYVDLNPTKAGELTRKEAGYVAEILTLAALQAGKNVLVDGSLRDHEWYTGYFLRLREEYITLKLAILHIVAPRDAVFKRAAARALTTGRVVPLETLEMALEQVPISVKILGPKVDYFCELNNAPDAEDIEILTDGITWESFTSEWIQTCAWVPKKKLVKASLNMSIT